MNSACREAGFTLIELLIVVAIIAILAAIAVPNFLEAQTRAKVSRVRADVRSVATAMETYKIDTNKYPPQADYPHAAISGATFLPNFHSRISSYLTTPVAHLNSIPYDVFIPGFHKPPQDHFNRYVCFNYEEYKAENPSSNTYKGRWEQTGGYLYYSYGPDQDTNAGTGSKPGKQGTYTRYDATNGTVSWGNIIRTAKDPEGFIPFNGLVTGSQNGPN